MYEVFDKFLAVDTWHTRHPLDEQRFFIALATVAKNPKFNPDDLGAYIRAKKGVSRDNEEHPFNFEIDDYVAKAWAVKDYLRVNGL
jgi:hypothetical protein